MQISKWGNCLAVRLPAVVVKAMGLKEGDHIEIHAVNSRNFQIDKIPDNLAILSCLRKYRGRLPKDFKFDRTEAHERG
jgi:antitoxin MazE